jgi:hypothetical protein
MNARPISNDTLYNLAARLACYPQHRDADAIPVVAVLCDGLPHIIGNARTPTGAKMLGLAFDVWAKRTERSTLPPENGGRQFYVLATVL